MVCASLRGFLFAGGCPTFSLESIGLARLGEGCSRAATFRRFHFARSYDDMNNCSIRKFRIIEKEMFGVDGAVL